MSCPALRWLLAGLLVVLGGAACGDDDAVTTLPPTTAGGSTSTAAWGEVVAPGSEAMLEGSRVLLREDFQDGDTAGWQVDAGWYLLENGERRMAAAGGVAWAWYQGGLDWSRYGARLGFLVNQGSLGVSFAVSSDGRYLVHLSDSGVYLLKDAPFGTISALGSAQPVAPGEPHLLAVGWDGGHLQVYVDGVLLIDAADLDPLAAGSIGLGAGDGSAVAVDNILVAALGGPLPDVQPAGRPADAPLPDDLGDGAPGEGDPLDDGGSAAEGWPNLVMVTVSYPPQIGFEQPFDVVMTVRNAGDAAAGPFSVVFDTLDGQQCAAPVEGLAAGQEATVTCRHPGFPTDPSISEYRWRAKADADEEVDEGSHASEDDNSALGIITIAGGPEPVLPNLTVGYTWWDPEGPGPDDPLTFHVGVTQTTPNWSGALAVAGFAVLYEDGSTACTGTATVSGADFGGSCEVPPFGASGEYWFTVVVDPAEQLAESDESDNAVIQRLLISANALFVPDLSFVQMLANGGVPIQAGQLFEADIVWDSNASADLPPYTVRMLIDDVVVCSQDLTQPKGATACLVTAPATAGNHVWTVQIDADDDIAESDESDNERSGVLRIEG